MNKKYVTDKEEFDGIIKTNLLLSGINNGAFCYLIPQNDGTVSEYTLYYSKTTFDVFVKEMQTLYPHHYSKYSGNPNATQNRGGVGGELIEKPGRYGLTPPKMASVASSSRFCYLAFRNGTDVLVNNKYISGDDIEFEKECRIFNDISTAPQLDGFIEQEEYNIYIEAKCHEIFDSHKVELKNKYLDYFEKDDILRTFLKKAAKDNETFTLPLSLFRIEKKSSRFDIKQLICHLLGIKEQKGDKKAKLVYLFFEPATDNDEDRIFINKVFDELSTEIKLIFESDIIKGFCETYNIELMAIKEKSRIMEALTKFNEVTIYP